ncbi:MAG: GlsB/YeaQ/YmgE family stress response membrane protein [Nocardioides sp.]|nr:GlsB/YeaQ/YmgE family stress response membrane protein [Nocardioides sp.]
MGIIGFIIVGLIAGFVARAVVPGNDSMGILPTIVLGMVGSFVGGLLGSIFADGPMKLGAAGIIGSIIGAIIALIVYNMVTGRKKVA